MASKALLVMCLLLALSLAICSEVAARDLAEVVNEKEQEHAHTERTRLTEDHTERTRLTEEKGQEHAHTDRTRLTEEKEREDAHVEDAKYGGGYPGRGGYGGYPGRGGYGGYPGRGGYGGGGGCRYRCRGRCCSYAEAAELEAETQTHN